MPRPFFVAMNESNFDLYIHDRLKEAGIDAEYQYTSNTQLQGALRTASKSQTGEAGKPDFIAVVGEYVLVIEDKAGRDKLCLLDSDGAVSQSVEATRDYAVNGALWYARKILAGSGYTKIFALGCAGDSRHHTMKPFFVDDGGVRELGEIETFKNFSATEIERYYRQKVLEEESPEELQLEDLITKSRELHEHLRNYGNLGDTEKPLVVSAILLALSEQKHGFRLGQLTGDDTDTDGAKLYRQLENSIKRARVSPDVKREKILNQFRIITDRPILNTKRSDIDMTPLKYFTDYLNREIYNAIELNATPEDYLGRFYGEFVRYSGGDGQTLGVVLTPRHITELFCDLVALRADDVIFDPCCGTGGFLIAGMHRMLQLAKSDSERKHIKEKQIFGTEIRNDMFAIATTNMILRGDGQSNLTCEDFLAKRPEDLQLQGITVGFMNPPYSQAKNKATQNLSELNFIYHLLESVLRGGRAAVIVPVSAMIGKTKEDRQRKADILKHHTLEGVISLNKQTFYGIGTVPCIAVFTAGEPHPKGKLAKFINFEDDGWEVKMHRGLVEDESRSKDRRQYLLECWRGERKDYPSKFMVETTVEAGDEWLHSFYYYNDEVPSEREFEESVADYLTFEANMIFHGRGYLFGEGSWGESERVSLEGVRWGEFVVGKLFELVSGRCSNSGNLEHDNMGVSYVGATNRNNGVLDFVRPVEQLMMRGNCIAFVKQGEGSVGYAVYKHEDFIASTSIAAGYAPFINKYTGIFITTVADKVRGKYSYNYPRSEARLKKEVIQLPIDDSGQPDYAFMERYIRSIEGRLIHEYTSAKQLTPPP